MDNKQWSSVEESRQRINADICPIDERITVPLAEALLAVLAEDVIAPFNVPGHDNSAMDGFACLLADVGHAQENGKEITLSVQGRAFAGHPYTGEAMVRGACIKIMTGAQVPAGCDVVVPQEETTMAANGDVVIAANPRRSKGLHIRAAGEDLRHKQVALAAGTLCFPAHIGLLASLGVERVVIQRRLRVAFFSTGDEVRTVGEALGASDVYDSNRHTLRAMIERMGFTAVDLGVVRDDPQQLAAAMDAAVDAKTGCADVIITSGGASVGEADYIRTVLAERGEVRFWKVAMRPGRPLAYGKIGGVDFFGLPGNPVSVMVCFYQFVREALWLRAGRRGSAALPLLPATTTTDLRHARGRTEFQRAVLVQHTDGRRTVTTTGDQGSGILSSMTEANCFIVIAAECEAIAAGDTVMVQYFEGLV